MDLATALWIAMLWNRIGIDPIAAMAGMGWRLTYDFFQCLDVECDRFGWLALDGLCWFSDRSWAFRHVSAGFQWAEFSMHGFLLSSLWAILRHSGDDDASVLLLIEDGDWNSFWLQWHQARKGV